MRARKRFAQHFLEPAWVRKVAASVAPRPTDALIEIGPGRGALTMALAESGPTMTVVELDRDLAEELRPRLPTHVTLVEGDVLDVDLAACARDTLTRRAARLPAETPPWPDTVRVAGNLPYNISTPLIARLIGAARGGEVFSDATLMVQLEVAERLAAAPGTGDYGPLSVLAQLWSDVAIVLRLPPGAFRPPPKVQSAVVKLTFRPPRVTVADQPAFDAMVRAVFLLRRKMLANALQPYATSVGTTAATALAAAEIDPRRRPETLSLAELARLSAALQPEPPAVR